MRFYTKEESKKSYPCIVFYKNKWDDFGHEITFSVYSESEPGNQVHLGDMKIISKDKKVTELPKSFIKLDRNYASLATSLEFYENLKSIFEHSTVKNILSSLNDVGYNRELRKNFEDDLGYKSALIRFTSSVMLLETVEPYINYNRLDIDELGNFEYSFKIPEASGNHVVAFDYRLQFLDHLEQTEFPFRINAIIGKNGTGKTQFLSSLVEALAGVSNTEGFKPNIPQFTKIIAISYSMFDNFPKPDENNVFSYSYIGYRKSESEMLNDESINLSLKQSLHKIIKKKKQEIFIKSISKILDINVIGLKNNDDFNEKWVESLNRKSTQKLSSGQSILFFILAELIAEILKKSFVLFDEPETHLHPAATSILIEILYDILQEHNSYALISTHSPLFLQNIPSRYIHVFEREIDMPIIKKLPMETFGANISEISEQVFGTVNIDEFYKKVFDDMTHSGFTKDYESPELFNKGLTFNAKLYLNS